MSFQLDDNEGAFTWTLVQVHEYPNWDKPYTEKSLGVCHHPTL
ncbi:MAG: hypothetical protein ACTS73_07225 [Arsenophonus sp. NEOnobi-MAG3]